MRAFCVLQVPGKLEISVGSLSLSLYHILGDLGLTDLTAWQYVWAGLLFHCVLFP